MKKQNRIHTFALSMMMTGLSVMPVWAFSGQIDSDSQLETVTCINHSTGQAVPGIVSGARFDCSALPQNLGDSIGVVLLGPGGDLPPPCNGSDVSIQEVEPNNDINQAQDLGALDCIIMVTGETTAGFIDPDNPDPNADADWYVISLAGAAQPQVEFLDFEGLLSFSLVDFSTEQDVDVECNGTTCAILGQHDRVALRVRTQDPGPYTLRFSDGAASQGLSALSSATHRGQIIHESR